MWVLLEYISYAYIEHVMYHIFNMLRLFSITIFNITLSLGNLLVNIDYTLSVYTIICVLLFFNINGRSYK